MKLGTKAFLFQIIIYMIVFLIIHTILIYLFPGLNEVYVAIISGFLMPLLSPQIKKNEVQGGNRFQIEWIFLKKILTNLKS